MDKGGRNTGRSSAMRKWPAMRWLSADAGCGQPRGRRDETFSAAGRENHAGRIPHKERYARRGIPQAVGGSRRRGERSLWIKGENIMRYPQFSPDMGVVIHR